MAVDDYVRLTPALRPTRQLVLFIYAANAKQATNYLANSEIIAAGGGKGIYRGCKMLEESLPQSIATSVQRVLFV